MGISDGSLKDSASSLGIPQEYGLFELLDSRCGSKARTTAFEGAVVLFR